MYFKTDATPEFLQDDRVAPAYGSLLQLHHTPIYHIVSKLFPVPRNITEELEMQIQVKKKVLIFLYSVALNFRK